MDNVHTVTVGERLDATYVFADYEDAQAFLQKTRASGRDAVYDEQVVIAHEDAQSVIDDADSD